MNSFLTLTKITPASFGRTLARQWDLLAIASLLVSSGAYSIYAITQMTGF